MAGSPPKNFIDPEFPHTPQSLFGNHLHPAKNPVIVWKRPCEIVKDGRPLAVFKDGASAGDVKQGALGDCWFLGALSCVGTRQDLTDPLFVESDVENGKYVIRFWKGGQWRYVTIDDYLPCNGKGVPAYAQSADLSELWVMLVEKAYAKLHGSYAALESGSVSEGLVDLTGGAPEEFDLDTPDAHENFWPRLLHFIEENWLMGCGFSTDEEKDPGNGLMQNHAYGIMNAVEIDGLRLIQLRNPWGEREWNGDWSDKSELWTPELKRKLNLSDSNDGVFWMCEADFLENFNKFYGSRLYEDKYGKQWQHLNYKGTWSGRSAGGCVNHSTWIYNPQYCLRVTRPDTDLYICLTQPDVRMDQSQYGKKAVYDHKIGFCLFNCEDGTIKKSGLINNDQFALKSIFTNLRQVAADIKLPPGRDYLLMPSTFEPGVVMDYVIDVFADEDIEMFPVPEPEEMSIDGQWSGSSAGGCVNHPTWKYNPQYFFYVKEKAKVALTLAQDLETKEELDYISLYLYAADTSGDPKRLLKPSKEVWKTAITNAKQVGEVIELEPSENAYILVPSTFKPGTERKFRVVIQTANAASITGLRPCIPWSEVTMTGIWNGVTAGGCRNHPTWRNNPMFFLTNNNNNNAGKEAQVTVTLSIGEEAKGKGVGVYIWPKEKRCRKMEAASREENLIKAPFTPNQTQITFKCTAGDGNYLIMPCTFDPFVNASFTLSVFSDNPVTVNAMSEATNFVGKVSGSWIGSNAGGSMNHKSWIHNPAFALDFQVDHEAKDDDEIDVAFLLTVQRPNASVGIGMSTIQPAAARTSLTARSSLAKSSFAMSDNNFLPCKIRRGHWIMPMTFDPNVEAEFSIYVYAPTKVKFTPVD